MKWVFCLVLNYSTTKCTIKRKPTNKTPIPDSRSPFLPTPLTTLVVGQSFISDCCIMLATIFFGLNRQRSLLSSLQYSSLIVAISTVFAFFIDLLCLHPQSPQTQHNTPNANLTEERKNPSYSNPKISLAFSFGYVIPLSGNHTLHHIPLSNQASL